MGQRWLTDHTSPPSNTASEDARHEIYHRDPGDNVVRSDGLDKVQMRWVLLEIVIAVLLVLELYHESVREALLYWGQHVDLGSSLC